MKITFRPLSEADFNTKSNSYIIYLIGKPGTGKYTIAKELEQFGFIICDNQLMSMHAALIPPACRRVGKGALATCPPHSNQPWTNFKSWMKMIYIDASTTFITVL